MVNFSIKRRYNFLGEVCINLDRASLTYSNYIKNGKTFIHAKILKECNLKIRTLLLENAFILSPSLQKEVIDLISHYDIWIEKWNDLEKKSKPQLEDVFIFKNEYIFPKNAENKIKEELLKVKQEF